MEEDDDGLPLEEATRAYGDPELVAAFDRARQAARGRSRRGYLWLGDEPIVGWATAEEIDRDNALIDQWDRARRDLSLNLIGRLQSGEVIATGLQEPLTFSSTAKPIRPHLWQVLVPDFRRSAAAGGGLQISAILVRRATAADQEETAAPRAVEEPRAPAPAGAEARRPGRPSIMHLIKSEMRRRAAAGQLHTTLRAESEVLAKWAQATHPDQRPPMGSSIRRRLGRIYRQLKPK